VTTADRPTGAEVRRRVLGDRYVNRTGGDPDPFMSEFYKLSVEHAWGGVWNRPGLELKQRSLVSVSVLAALGRTHELRIHLNGALNNGWTPEELREICLHLAPYAGYPASLDALKVLSEVVKERTAG
jgi:4-carboxymuconolactone decarboxylase